jgi:hypothetical protein
MIRVVQKDTRFSLNVDEKSNFFQLKRFFTVYGNILFV